jgi:AGZA family xanthine/uracil permease-like MFS transporter
MTAYPWARRGDVNAFFGLMLDNLAVMIILVSTLARTGLFSADFILEHMIPGTALGVLIGDLVYTVMAFRLARRLNRPDVTAMPLGLDTPSTFGVAFLVLIPARLHAAGKLGLDAERGMEFAWHVGLVTLVLVGVFKTALAPFGNAVRRLIPRAGLLGSLAAIAIALIAFLPLLLDGIAAVPLVGMLALGLILFTLVAHRELPGRFPGALGAVLLGVAVYWIGHLIGSWGGFDLVPPPQPPLEGRVWQPAALWSLYGADGAWWTEVLTYALGRLPVALPFALATIVGGIDCTESAAAAGDEYDTRTILLTEGLASLAAGLLGGVIQTTPYIGHPAYKKMGGRAAYTLTTALFVGVVGCVGGFTYLYAFLPTAAMFPIFVFVGLEITAQSFHATPQRHYPALAFAMLPALAYLITVPLKQILFVSSFSTDPLRADDVERAKLVLQTLRCLANGFLISSMLWASGLAMILDGKLRSAAAFFLAAGACAFVGLIHSPLADEQIGLPWAILAQFGPDQPHAPFRAAVSCQTPYHWAGAYGLLALMLLGLAALKPQHDQDGEVFPAALPQGRSLIDLGPAPRIG